MKRLLTIFMMTLLIFTNVYAKDDIQVYLETPSVLQGTVSYTHLTLPTT